MAIRASRNEQRMNLRSLSEAMLLEEENSSSVLLSKADDFLGLFERKGRRR
jgi:hypothetical protein